MDNKANNPFATTKVEGAPLAGTNGMGQHNDLMSSATSKAGTSPWNATKLANSNKGQKKKGGKIALIVILVVILLAVIGVGVWYFVYYNNNSVVARDAMAKLIKTESYTTTTKLKIEANGQSMPESTIKLIKNDNNLSLDSDINISAGDGVDLSVKAGVVRDGNSIYFKLDNIDDIASLALSSYASSLDQQTATVIQTIISKINDTWFKLGTDDIRALDAENGDKTAKIYTDSLTCVDNLQNTLRTNAKTRNEWVNAYMDNEAIQLTRDGSDKDGIRINVNLDTKKLKAFYNAIKDTEAWSSTVSCFAKATDSKVDDINKGIDNMIDEAAKQDTSKVKNKITLWISGFGHQLNKVETVSESDDAKITTTTAIDYNKATVTKPSKSTTIQKFVTDLQSSLQGSLQSSLSGGQTQNLTTGI